MLVFLAPSCMLLDNILLPQVTGFLIHLKRDTFCLVLSAQSFSLTCQYRQHPSFDFEHVNQFSNTILLFLFEHSIICPPYLISFSYLLFS